MYQSTVPQLIKMLENLDRWIEKGVEHATQKSFDPSVLLHARLAPDQLHFTRQVQIACDHAKFIASRLAGKDPPRHEDNEQTVDELRARVRKVVDYLKTFSEKDFEGAEARRIVLPRQEGKVLTGADYLAEFGLPNFYFHVTTAYAILRHNGVALGKRDFLGALSFRDA